MTHPRVEQLRFARSEWVRGLRGLSRPMPINASSR